MKKLIAILSLAVLPAAALASSEAIHLESANIDVANEAAIQRGAKVFVNYCQGCHTLKHVRYKLLTTVGLSDDDIKGNLMFGGGKVGDHMTNAMPPAEAASWFGAPPPDLSLEIRRRKHDGGADWVYTYLKSFYTDPTRPLGVNNTVFHNVGMPNVLWSLQGTQELVPHEGGEEGHGGMAPEFKKTGDGAMTEAEFDATVRDLTTFLAYVSEPVQLERKRLGIWVLLFLGVFTVIAYLLKKNYWQDVH